MDLRVDPENSLPPCRSSGRGRQGIHRSMAYESRVFPACHVYEIWRGLEATRLKLRSQPGAGPFIGSGEPDRLGESRSGWVPHGWTARRAARSGDSISIWGPAYSHRTALSQPDGRIRPYLPRE